MMPSPQDRRRTVGTLALAMFWLGLLIGVSFLATPAKFLAPSLPLPVALDVGRHTFAIFNKVEWALAAALLLFALVPPRVRLGVAAAVVSAAIVLAETVWLLPLLDQRVGLLIAGQQLPASDHHNLYIALEGMKLIALGLLAAVVARRLGGQPAESWSVGAVTRHACPERDPGRPRRDNDPENAYVSGPSTFHRHEATS